MELNQVMTLKQALKAYYEQKTQVAEMRKYVKNNTFGWDDYGFNADIDHWIDDKITNKVRCVEDIEFNNEQLDSVVTLIETLNQDDGIRFFEQLKQDVDDAKEEYEEEEYW